MTVNELKKITTITTKKMTWEDTSHYTHKWTIAGIHFKGQHCPSISGDKLYAVGIDDPVERHHETPAEISRLMNILADYERAETTTKENKQ